MRKWLAHIFLVFTAVATAAGQAIAPGGTTDWTSSHVITSTSDEAYAVTYDADGIYDLRHWDLGGWVDLGAINLLPKHGLNPDGEFNVVDVIRYNGQIFVAGKYYIDLSGTASNYVVVWDGNSWTAYSDTLITNSSDLTKFLVHEGDLLLIGMFGGSSVSSNLLKLNTDNTWSEFGDLLTHDEASDYINDAIVYNGLIYASGGFTNPKLVGQRLLASLRNGEWVIEGLVPFQKMADNMAIYNSGMVLYGNPTISSYDYFKRLSGGSWQNISNGLEETEIIELNSIVQVGNYLWATGKFRDTVTESVYSIMYFNGIKWTMAETGEISQDLIAISLVGTPYVYGNFTYQDAVNFGRIYTDKALLSGRVFHDMDGNCIWSPGDVAVRDAMIQLTPGGHIVGLNSDGTYEMPVSKGNYTVKLLLPDYWKTSCNTSTSVNVQELVTYNGLDFGIEPIPDKVDITADLTDFNGWVLQLGQTNALRLCVYNRGTQDAQNVKVVLNVDDRLTGYQFEPQPDVFDGSVAEWTLSSLKAGAMTCFLIKAVIPGSIEAPIEFSYELILPDGRDENTDNNTGTTSFETTDESFDPVTKSSANGAKIAMDETWLKYKIRIHNISSEVIDRIVIIDTLDEDLYMYGAEYLYTFASKAKFDRIPVKDMGDHYQYRMIWTFDNAQLVDSATDPLASIGFLDVKLNLVPNKHPKETQICNTAIVFAENSEPIRTNMVCGAFGSISVHEVADDPLQIRPNPAAGTVRITNPVGETVNAGIYTSDGRLIMQFTLSPMENREVDIHHLVPGCYFIKIEGAGAARLIKSSN